MSNLSQVLQQEIARVARRELRSEIQALKGVASRYRSEVAALKRELTDLKRHLTESGRVARKSARIAAAVNSDTSKMRYSAKNLAALRRRLGLSQGAFATLLGVSSGTIYNWESGNGRPNKQRMVRIAAARSLSKKEALAIVANVA